MDGSNNQPPDRWLACPSFGQVIDDTFLPMKTLLSEDHQIPEDYQFTPEIFIRKMRDMKLDIGLVINLTFSQRYYDSDDLIDLHNVKYKQIPCRGHNEAPQDREQAEFIRICRMFLAQNPRKIIAVHCTHGFNRTGFMICCFLCSERDWAIDAAISHFSEKRPPGIYKQDYINELLNLFGDSDDPVPDAPPRPAWDDDNALMLGREVHPIANSANNIEEFYEGITDVQPVRDDALKTRIYRHCCMLTDYRVDSPGVHFPGAQPVSMDHENIRKLESMRYRVSWKADGCRFMLYIKDEDNIFFLNRNLQLWRVNNLKFPQRFENPKNITSYNHLLDTFVDGEMVTDIENGNPVPRYLIYDVIAINGQRVAQQDFDRRCDHINQIIQARRHAKQANIIPVEGEPFKVAAKGFWPVQTARKTWLMNVTHEKDGLIFQPVDPPYRGGTCDEILKWKPASHNSIDFRLVIREERQNGCLPETVVYLHVSNTREPILKYKMTSELESQRRYNNKIVEMTYQNRRWIVQRERTDKLTPNSFETAQATFKSIINPVTETQLFTLVEGLPKESVRQSH